MTWRSLSILATLAGTALACGARSSLEVADSVASSSTSTSSGAGGFGGAPPHGGSPPGCLDAVLATDEDGARFVALPSDVAYWTSGDAHVMSAPLTGGPPTALTVTGPDAGAIAIDGGDVYWAEPTQILRMPLGGGAIEVLADGQSDPIALAVDAGEAWWLDYGGGLFGGDVMHLRADGAVESLVKGIDTPTSMRIDATHVYFTAQALEISSGTIYGALTRVPRGGGPAEYLLVGLHDPTAVALDADRFYWLEQQDESLNENGVLYVSDKGAALPQPKKIGTVPKRLVLGLAVDATNAYVTALGGPPSVGALFRLPLAGGPATELAELAGVLYGDVALTEHAVVWTANWMPGTAPPGTPSVRKLCK
jgi:hypothetical protein